METKINLIEILKDKPLNFKLYDAVRNIDVFLDEVLENINEIRCKLDEDGRQMIYYSHKGTLVNFEDGIVALVPSKGMRDWKKFLWKKGDVLVSNNGKTEIIFDKFDDDSYTMFSGKHGLDCTNGTRYDIDASDRLPTDCFNKESEDAAKTYISIIERRLGGKLNLETLEIEKQTEFNDGDIIKMTWDKYSAIVIFWEYSNFGKGFDSHVFFNIKTKIIEYNIRGHTLRDTILRFATEEEKQQLFDTLAKKGKAWDADKKMVVDIKKEHQFKPFEKVLVRDSYDDVWRASFFSHIKENDGSYVTTCVTWKFCIPYIGNESLLGTTDNFE